MIGQLLFNVLVSGAFSFLGALLLVSLVTWRTRDGGFRLALLLLPFAKLAYEIARGVPHGAFFWEKAHGARQELGSFVVGFGLDHGLPVLRMSLGALWKGRTYPQSAADILATALSRKVSPSAPAIVAAALIAVGLALVIRRATRTARRSGTVVERRRVGLRTVSILLSTRAHVPFAGGVLRPWICFPESMYRALPPSERDAVIEHELAHLRHHDVLLLGAVHVLRDLFWFVPGISRLVRAVVAQCELRADAAARARGVDGATLASALVRVAESMQGEPPMLAFAGRKPLLARRVSRLLASPLVVSTARRWMQAGLVFVIASFVLRAITGGNP
ncbi:MAG: M56 family metallopeptidase [Polyangiales bacterium]